MAGLVTAVGELLPVCADAAAIEQTNKTPKQTLMHEVGLGFMPGFCLEPPRTVKLDTLGLHFVSLRCRSMVPNWGAAL